MTDLDHIGRRPIIAGIGAAAAVAMLFNAAPARLSRSIGRVFEQRPQHLKVE
jgi:hypothetical protein